MSLHEKILMTMFIAGILLSIIGWVIYKIMNDNETILSVTIMVMFVLVGIPTIYGVGKLVYWMFSYIWR